MAERNPNVYIDLSEYEHAPMADAYIQACNTMIPDKVLYASAHPFVDFKDALKKYEQLPLKPEARQQIMYGNAAKLLGLAPAAPGVAAATVGNVSAPTSDLGEQHRRRGHGPTGQIASRVTATA